MTHLPPTTRFQVGRDPTPTLADAAIALGVPVFPCGDDKAPLTLTGFKAASTNPDEIRRMFANPRATMIGMPTGDVSGWVVVDVDVRDGAQGAAWLDAHTEDLVPTRTVKTRSGGWHLYFTAVPGMRNSASKIAPNVDIRGNGGYVIVPPSPGYSMADPCGPADMPAWLIEAAMPAPIAPREPVAYQPRVQAQDTSGGTPYGLAALDAECAAIRNAYDGTKHATLNKAGFSIGGLVTAGELPSGLAISEMRSALATIRSSCKDYSAAERTLHRAFDEGKGLPRAIPERQLDPVDVIHPAAELLAKLNAKAARQTAKARPVSADLMDAGGALGMFVDHCNATAISPQPFLALAAGICAIGALAGRQYRTKTNLRTNIYAVGIADSGGGKDHARKQVKAVMSAAGLTRYLGGEDVASGNGLLTALARHPAMLFQIDEFGDWLASILGKTASTHKKQIGEKLKVLYSSADSFIGGTEYADQSAKGRAKEDIQQPHACLYGTTTPGQFWSAIASGSMHDGLMARMMIFLSPCSYPDEAEPVTFDPPDELVDAFQQIAAGGATRPALGNLPTVHIAEMTATAKMAAKLVHQTPDADAAIKDLRRDQLAQQRQAEGTYVTALAARMAENAVKLALVRAISRNPAQPLMDGSDVAWGRALAEHCIATLIEEAGRNIADNEYEARLNKAAEIVRKHGPITERDMIRKGFKLPGKDRSEILRTLVDMGTINAVEFGTTASGGRPTIRYITAPSANATTQEENAK